ncbi:VWA domain-containing protein [Flavobacterium flavigenum]|uniref:VWA domain-containing protein n=1 Tax=Flavobacterium flavigenum TaxID=3003258 RepID=UPI002482D86E|nr:leucine-rich repeat domain-containing protein [Flavobacterium flavigenum]
MTNIFKIKKYWIITVGMVLLSLASFAQNYDDKTIGFDLVRITASLKKHGVKEENLQQQIALARKQLTDQFIKSRESEELLVKKIKSEWVSKKEVSRSTAKTASASIPQSERDALIAFYNSTNGPNWNLRLPNNGIAWQVNNPDSDVAGWYGVRVENGHVIGIELWRANLSGSLPDEIGQLTELKSLIIQQSPLSGALPQGLFLLNNLEVLILYSNNIEGSIPPAIANLHSLQVLDLGSNELTGFIPIEIAQLTALKSLSLDSNRLSGTIPQQIGQLTLLEGLGLSSNYYLTGNIPLELYNLTHLKGLTLNNNQLTGDISPLISRLTQLTLLSLNHNNLTGPIPNEIYQLSNLDRLFLGNNDLNGNLSPQISNLNQLYILSLENNNLTGTIPAGIGQLSLLQFLYLSDNQFTGEIPSTLRSLTYLRTLAFDLNQLSGPIPDFTNSPLLTALGFRNNNFRYTDFANEFNTYANNFEVLSFAHQNKIDSEKTITVGTGGSTTLTMYEDNRFTPEETYQWYKGVSPNGVLIEGATSRNFVLSNLDSSNEGDYYCISTHPEISLKLDPWGFTLTLERNPIHLAVTNCTPVNMVLKVSEQNPMQNTNVTFSLETSATNITYNWKFYNANNALIDTKTTATVLQNFATPGIHKVVLEVTDATGCVRKFEKSVTVIDPCSLTAEERSGRIFIPGFYGSGAVFVPLNETITPELDLYYQNPVKPYSYKWSLLSPKGQLINSGTQSTFPIVITAEGFHKIELEITDINDGCKTKYIKTIGTLIQNSCTNENPKSIVVRNHLINLLTKLISRSILGETDEEINKNSTINELVLLKPYITNITGNQIYNYVTTRNEYNQITNVDFSFAPERDSDVHISVPNGIYYYEDGTTEELYSNIEYGIYIDITQYRSSSDYLTSCKVDNGGRMSNKSSVIFEPYDCARSSDIRYIDFCPAEEEIVCVNKPVNLNFETESSNLTYSWYAIKSGTTQHLNPVTNTTGLYTFTPLTDGTYIIHLNAYKNNECQFEFRKTISAKSCEPFVSCTKSNRNSPVIKGIFTTLVNKLLSLPAEDITYGYNCDELTALSPYIKDQYPGIYNFTRDTEQGFVAFSFNDHTDYDVKIAITGNSVADFNLDNYESDTVETELRTGLNDPFKSFVNHIDFCSALYCVSHIAFVLDESGSIGETEADKIRKQLKNYIQQQANDNDKLQSNVYVSLIGMSDKDDDNRDDHVKQIRVTNEPGVLKQFNTWIANYCKYTRGKRRVSAAADYWNSGLNEALSLQMKPSVVIMITDGCQTANVEKLKETMSKFDNYKNTTNTSTEKPHLYVLGIENGFYVDKDTYGSALLATQDPNYVQTSAAFIDSKVVPNLRTSLKYLLNYQVTEFPQEDIKNFRDFDFYGYEDFNSLAYPANEAFLSDNLKISGFSCGKPTDKNYCSDCLSFQPVPGKEYMLSAWVKEESPIQVKTYDNVGINIHFYSDAEASELQKISTQKLIASGDIIDGWQRITSKFLIPKFTKTISIELQNNSNGIAAYFDDIRIHPLEGSIKTFVYDPQTFKLMSELDENNYSTFYEYDNEGGLVRVKKETAKGIKTIQETRSGNFINTTKN